MPKSAFVTIAGRTNAGKSSLLNALVGEKIASVSNKPQTTRTRITGIKTIGDTELKLAVVNGLANARKLLKRIDEGEAFYHLIEVMTCQGGCVGGAGQPYGLKATKEKRGDGLHQSDNAAMFKRAERNPIVVRMMAEYGEERCHELLHVSYRGE